MTYDASGGFCPAGALFCVERPVLPRVPFAFTKETGVGIINAKDGRKDSPLMSLTKDAKTNLIKEFQTNEKDTGSCQVQIAILTERINALGAHFKQHVKDNHSRRGLLMLVSKRRRLLRYLQRENLQDYRKLIDRLKIRK